MDLVFGPIGAEQSGGASGSETLATDSVWENSCSCVDRLRSGAETLGDVQSGDVVRLVMDVIVGVEWCVRGCIAESQVLDSSANPFSDIPEGLVIGTVSNSFASYTVLLVSKDESNEGAPSHVMQRTDGCIEIVLGRGSEENILQPERRASSLIIGSGLRIFSWSTEEEVCEAGEVNDGIGEGSIWVVLENLDEGHEDGEATGRDSSWGWVFVFKEFEDAFETRDVFLGLRETGIFFTQLGEPRSDST